jgi:hypothetical protein
MENNERTTKAPYVKPNVDSYSEQELEASVEAVGLSGHTPG